MCLMQTYMVAAGVAPHNRKGTTMAITPADIERMTFSEDKKSGYNTDEVDAFLDQLSVEVDAMLKKIADLKGRLTNSEQQLASSQAQIAQLKEQSAASDASQLASSSLSASEKQISQVLIVAQQSADKLLADAHANADAVRTEADQKAREVIRQALAEKQNELDEIDRLKQSQENFRSAYKKMLQHFMDDADSVLPRKGANGSSDISLASAEKEPQSSVSASASTLGDFSDLD